MSLLYLFRHGEAATPGLLTGRSDPPLTAQGEEQARQWGKYLAEIPFTAAWSSPLRRSVQTAKLILQGNAGSLRQAKPVPGLEEIHLGEWEGKDKAVVVRDYPDIWEKRGRDLANVAPPGGESFNELSARVLPVFAATLSKAVHHKCSLVVAHQAVNRVILAHIQGLALSRVLEIPLPPCALAILRLSGNGQAVTVEQFFSAPACSGY